MRKGLGSLVFHWDVLSIAQPLESGWMTPDALQASFTGQFSSLFFPCPCMVASCVGNVSSFQPDRSCSAVAIAKLDCPFYV